MGRRQRSFGLLALLSAYYGGVSSHQYPQIDYEPCKYKGLSNQEIHHSKNSKKKPKAKRRKSSR